MTFLWRRRRTGCSNRNRKVEVSKQADLEAEVLSVPPPFQCPISHDLMKDPVSLSTGITYDRESIEKWFNAGNVTCPVTNQVLGNLDQIPNHTLRKMIQHWCVENKSYGVQRIPTPRIPITPHEVSTVCSKLYAATRLGEDRKCLQLLEKIKNLAKESERNKRCIVSNGIDATLANAFESFSRSSFDKHAYLLKETLSILAWHSPLGEECVSKMKSTLSLRCTARFLNDEDLCTRQNAIVVLKELVSTDQGCVEGLMEIKGIEETLFHMVKVPICLRSTQACLVVIHHMMMLSQEKSSKITLRFVEMGLMSLILEILVDGNKAICEKALGVFDSICNSEEGRRSAYENALAIPLIVKKILRVSNAATEVSISILWKLCFGENKNVMVESLQLGAFQKLLVVLQVGCGERTKEKVSELLKLMNLYRGRVDCFDASMGFKYLK